MFLLPQSIFSFKELTKTVLAHQPCIKQISFALIITLLVVGCAAPPPAQITLNSVAHQQSLKQQNNWAIKGRIGFKGPNKKESAYFRWQQKHQQYSLNLTSIIGTAILKLQGDAGQVSLVTDDQTYKDTNPSRLISRVTGWQIPVENLRLWIKGQHQQSDNVLTSEQGWISQLQPICDSCENWLITYDNYKLVGKVWLPHKVVLNNQLDNSQLLIKVNEWTLNE